MKEPISLARRRTRESDYDPQPFIARMNELLKKNKESYREAALSSSLDHQAVRRILAGQQPSMTNCILLADHFRINANEFLALAGWPTLKAFEIQAFNQEQLPPEVVEVALSLAKVSNPGIRKDTAAAFLTLINTCINQG